MPASTTTPSPSCPPPASGDAGAAPDIVETMTSTPAFPENEDLDELESKTEEELVAPEEKHFERLSEPRPTDGIGTEKWDEPASDEELDD